MLRRVDSTHSRAQGARRTVFLREEQGATAVEYALMICLIAVLVAIGVGALGNSSKAPLERVADALNGSGGGTAAAAAAAGSAGDAAAKAGSGGANSAQGSESGSGNSGSGSGSGSGNQGSGSGSGNGSEDDTDPGSVIPPV